MNTFQIMYRVGMGADTKVCVFLTSGACNVITKAIKAKRAFGRARIRIYFGPYGKSYHKEEIKYKKIIDYKI